jgi:hypothetical protein
MSSNNKENTLRTSKRQRKAPSKPDDSPQKAPPAMPLPHHNRIDASQFSVEGILQLRTTNRSWAERLDYINCSDEMIRGLFVSQSVIKTNGGQLMPPKALRRTQKLLNHFFGLGSNI